MTGRVGEWILSVTCCGIIVSIVQSLLPAGMWKRIGMLAGGLLLITTVVDPLVDLEVEDLEDYLMGFSAQQEELGENLSDGSRELLEKLITEEYRTYILNSAEELGIFCDVSVSCEITNEGIPLPSAVVIVGSMQPEQREKLTSIIESELGVAEEAQIYRERE